MRKAFHAIPTELKCETYVSRFTEQLLFKLSSHLEEFVKISSEVQLFLYTSTLIINRVS